MEDPCDQKLIAAANRGDVDAMTALYHRYRDWTISTARRFCGDPDEALDIAQQVFVYFFGKFPGLSLSCQVKTLLYPVIRHRSIDVLRKRRATPTDPAALPEGEAVSVSRPNAIRELVAELPPEQRDVVLCRFEEGMSLAAVATRLGVPVGTVKSRLHHALRKLRTSLG